MGVDWLISFGNPKTEYIFIWQIGVSLVLPQKPGQGFCEFLA